MADLSFIQGSAHPSSSISSTVADVKPNVDSKDEKARQRVAKRKPGESVTLDNPSQGSNGDKNKEDDSVQAAPSVGEGMAAKRPRRSRNRFDAVISSSILTVESTRDVPVFDAGGKNILLTSNAPEPSSSTSSRTNGNSNLVLYEGPQVRRAMEQRFPLAYDMACRAGLQSLAVDLNYAEGSLGPLKGACDALKKMLLPQSPGVFHNPAVRRVSFASLDMAMGHHRLLFDSFRAIPEKDQKEEKERADDGSVFNLLL